MISPPPLQIPIATPQGGLTAAWLAWFDQLRNVVSGFENEQDISSDAISALASLSIALSAVLQELQTLPRQEYDVSAVLQELQTLPKPPLGTMAPLQQDNLPWVAFDTTPQSVPSLTTGTLYWDAEDRSKTLALVMEDTGQIVQDIGEETFYRVKASSAITKGQVVMFTGTVGASGGLIAAPATGLTVGQSEYILGIATQDIALNGWGYITWFGEIKGVNTTGGAESWVDGQILYYNPAVTGGLTKNVPTAPNVKVLVAAVVHAATNGVLFVRPTFGSALGATDANVEIAGLAGGDLLQYDGVQSRWENIPASTVIANAGGAPITKTTDFTVAVGETWLINNKSGSSCIVTLPTASANTGRTLHFQNYQAQTLVSAASNVVPLAGGSATTSILEAVAGANSTLVSNGTNWIMTKYDSNNSLELE